MSLVLTAAARSRKVGRTIRSARSDSTTAWATSSSSTAGVSITSASTPPRTAAAFSANSLGPEVATTSGPSLRRALNTSIEECCGSASASMVTRPRRWKPMAMWTAIVVLPDPPLRPITATERIGSPHCPGDT